MNFTNNENTFPFKFAMVGTGAIETLNIEFLKFFDANKEKATDGWIINETFYKKLLQQYSEEQISTSNFPQENEVVNDGRLPFKILGVVKDFHYVSLHSPIENFAFNMQSSKSTRNRFMLVRYQQKNFENILSQIRATVTNTFPDKPFNYHFLNDELHEQYKSENTVMRLVNFFSVLCILVALLGLIGITLIMLDNRVKEIGIRKVNGAKISEILILLDKDIIKWVGLAFIFAVPISYYAMQNWLQNFAYKTEISWWIFALSGGLAFILTAFIVTLQSWKTATKNPVEALRYE